VSLDLVLFMVVVVVLALALLIWWDRLVGTALVGVATGATWLVARSADRWWFSPVVVFAALVVIAALVVAGLIS
jgi:hypothetical protein